MSKCFLLTGAAQPWLRFFFLSFLLFFGLHIGSAQIRLHWESPCLLAEGLPTSLQERLAEQKNKPEYLLKLFRLHDSKKLDPAQNAMWGRYEQDADTLFFYPQFKLRLGAWYRAVWIYSSDTVVYDFQVPRKSPIKPPQLIALSPQLDTLPANLLKFYLHFSQPMAEGQAYQKVELLDEDGKLMSLPFVPLQPELWDASHQRLTLWLDPGRIKRGLGPNQASGAPLKAGSIYTLRIRADWKDQQGQSLEKVSEHNFWVGAADRQSPQIETWTIECPPRESRDSLCLRLGESLDAALLRKCIRVYTKSGEVVPGQIKLSPHQDEWIFKPDMSWLPGAYEIKVQSILEDLAGNNLNRPFDRDLKKDPVSPSRQAYYSRFFEVK